MIFTTAICVFFVSFAFLPESQAGQVTNIIPSTAMKQAVHDTGWVDGDSSIVRFLTREYRLGKSTLTHIINQSYLLSEYNVSDKSYVVISQKSGQNIFAGEPVPPYLISADAFLIANGQMSKKLWSMDQNIGRGELFNVPFLGVQFYRIRYLGDTLFALQTGDPVIQYIWSFLSISVPNSPIKRLIGLVSRPSTLFGSYREEDRPQYIGTLTYASPESGLHAIVFKTTKELDPDPNLFYYGQGFSISIEDIEDSRNPISDDKMSLALLSADGSHNPNDISGFSIRIKFQYIDEVLTIPIRNDDFDLENLDLKEFIIERIK